MKRIAIFVWAVASMLSGGYAVGQDAGGARPLQLDVFIGRMLPHGVSNEDEIFPVYGGRVSVPMGGEKSSGGYFDGGFLGGNGPGVSSWDDLFAGVSLQAPIETLIIHAGVGIDLVRYDSDSISSPKITFGEHFVGGVAIRLASGLLTRFDMKFNTAPGTTVMFALGFVFEL